MNQIKIFENPTLGKLRATADDKGEAWINVNDACRMVSYTNGSVTVNNRISNGSISSSDVQLFNSPNPMPYIRSSKLDYLIGKRDKDGTVRSWIMTAVGPKVLNTFTSDTTQQTELNFEQTSTPVPTTAPAIQSDIQLFEHPQFGMIHTVADEQDEVWFLAKDICDILGYGNPRDAIQYHVDRKDVGKFDTLTKKGEQLMLYVNESGLYALILGSKMPNVQPFKHWVTSEILPSVRKHGIYLTPQAAEDIINNPDLVITLATQVKEARAKNNMLLARNAELQQENENQSQQLQEANDVIEEQKQQLDEQAPAVEIGNALLESKVDRDIEWMAKTLATHGIYYNGKPIGRNQLFEWFRRHGVLFYRTYTYGYQKVKINLPYQDEIDKGLFKIGHTKRDSFMSGELLPVTYLTPKGQAFFLNKFLELKGDRPTYDAYFEELDDDGNPINNKI